MALASDSAPHQLKTHDFATTKPARITHGPGAKNCLSDPPPQKSACRTLPQKLPVGPPPQKISPLSSECGMCRTVKARFWPRLSYIGLVFQAEVLKIFENAGSMLSHVSTTSQVIHKSPARGGLCVCVKASHLFAIPSLSKSMPVLGAQQVGQV